MTKLEALEKILGKQNSYVYQIKQANPMIADYIQNVAVENTMESLKRQIKTLEENLKMLEEAK